MAKNVDFTFNILYNISTIKFSTRRKNDMEKDKKEALESAIKQIKKQYGPGALMRLGENASMNVDAISTGSLTLDIATGIGGFPRGRIIEIYGPESSGKTTLALHCIAEAQKMGGEAAFIDAEHALDPVYASNLGVVVDSLLVSQPDYGEQALEITEQLVRSGAVDVIVVDSVAALVPKTEIEDDMGDSHIGLQARLMSQALRKLTAAVNKSKTLIIFINQLREKVGVVYGNPEVTTGGRALKFYSSMRIEVRKSETIKGSNSESIGNKTKVKVVKNKLAPPFKSAEFEIMFGTGISKAGEIVDLAVKYGIIKKSGAWFSYGDRRLGQGREKIKTLMNDEPDFAKEVEEKVLAQIKEEQLSPNHKYEAEVTSSDKKVSEPAEMKTDEEISRAREAARKKLDIVVEDDDE